MRIAAVIAALAIALVALAVVGPPVWPSSSSAFDCGPDGKPALGGRACIDREPAVVTWP